MLTHLADARHALRKARALAAFLLADARAGWPTSADPRTLTRDHAPELPALTRAAG